MFCLYCGNKLPVDAIFCDRCGKRQREEENVSMSGNAILTGPALPETIIGGGQLQMGNVPLIQGIPQASTAPTIQGTPANLNYPPDGQALPHNMAPSSSSLSASSQAPTPHIEPSAPIAHYMHSESPHTEAPTSYAHHPHTEHPDIEPKPSPTHHPHPGHQSLRSSKQTLTGHVTRRAVITGLVGVTTVAIAGGGLAVGVLSGKLKIPFLSGSSTTAPVLANLNFPMFGFDPQHTHLNPYEKVLSPTNVSKLVQDWTFQAGGSILSSPAVANGVVYIGSWDHNVYALDARSGRKLWVVKTGDHVFSSPAVANGAIYVGSNDNNLYALDARTGSKLWAFRTGSTIVSSPAVANGVVYVGSYDNNLYALDAHTGSKLWAFQTGDVFMYSSPAVANGVVYAGSYDHTLYALDARTGSKLWAFQTGLFITSSPAVANGVVYIGSEDQSLYALDARTGSKLWAFQTGSVIEASSPAVANGVVYVGSNDNKLYAFHLLG